MVVIEGKWINSLTNWVFTSFVVDDVPFVVVWSEIKFYIRKEDKQNTSKAVVVWRIQDTSRW